MIKFKSIGLKLLNSFVGIYGHQVVGNNRYKKQTAPEVWLSLGIDVQTVIDVGANIGKTVQEFQRAFPSARIVAIEPDPRMVNILKKQKNKNFEIIQAGIGPANNEVEFFTSKEHPHINSMLEFNGADVIKVKQITLKKLLENLKINKLDVLKIDAEGYDEEVIKSGSELFKKGMISAVSVEVSVNNVAHNSSNFFKIHNVMENFGYGIVGFYDIDYSSIETTGLFKTANVIYVAPKYRGQLF